jgi:diaminopimelate epimerase
LSEIEVVTMSGAGNDFVVVGPDEAARIAGREAEFARSVCRRGLSVGADGLLLVEPAGRDRVRVRFFNPDGTETFCGNGSRCAARYARERGLAADALVLETAAGEVHATVDGAHVRVTLPAPRDGGVTTIDVAGEPLTGRLVVAGVPHFVIEVGDPARAPLERWGPGARAHARFAPDGTNVDVLGPTEGASIAVRTWERGVERETLACGSGAVAAAYAARLRGAGERLLVVPRSGVALEVELPGPPAAPLAAVLAGEARFVLRGRLAAESAPPRGAA